MDEKSQTEDWWISTNPVARERVIGTVLGPRNWGQLTLKEQCFTVEVLNAYLRWGVTHGV